MHLDRAGAKGFASCMATPPTSAPDAPPPPLGTWTRTYVATMVLAVVVIACLWLLTATCNVPLGSAR